MENGRCQDDVTEKLEFSVRAVTLRFVNGNDPHLASAVRGSFDQCLLRGGAFRRVPSLLATILSLLALQATDVSAAESAGPKAPPAPQGLALLIKADTLLKAGQLAEARKTFEQVVSLSGAMEHQVWEARRGLAQIERREAGLPMTETNTTRMHLPDAPAPAITLYVSPRGEDTNPGSESKPLASLEGARDRLRLLRKSGFPKGASLIVVVHEGEYRVTHTLQFAAEDSGSELAPVVFRAATGEKPRFTGGLRLRGFQPISDPEVLKRLPSVSKGKALELDLRRAGITNLLPLALGGFASGRGFTTHSAHELFVNGQAMRLARGPNEGFLRIADVAVKDGTKGYDREGSKIGKFYYSGDLPARWANEPNLLLYGYWFWDWADSYEQVVSIETSKRLITLKEPWHKYGYSIGAPFCAVNALCELDLPGEYYLDARNLRLIFYPPSDPEKANVELSVLAATMMDLQNVSHVRFEQLTFELGCNDGIHVNGGTNCIFAGCIVCKFAGTGIEVNDGYSNGLLSCDIYSLGRGGVILRGGDRKTLIPSGHFIENCDIHELSRIDHTYTPAVAASGVGHHTAHNRFHDILSSALNITGNDHVIEYNEVFEVVKESDDQGGVDMFGNPTYRGNIYRFNYWHHIGNWRAVGERPKCGQAGIRLDDAICGTLIYGNVFERCSTGKDGFGGVQIHGGKNNIIDNNLFIDCAAGISFSPWEEKRWREYVAPYMSNAEIDPGLYLKRYPSLATLSENVNTNTVYRNLFVRCGEMLRHPPTTIDLANNEMLPDADCVLKPENPLLKRPGFARIPVEDIGLYRDRFRVDSGH